MIDANYVAGRVGEVRLGALLLAMGRSKALKLRELADDGVMHEPVDRYGSGHGTSEDAVSLTEDEIARDHQAFAPAALGHE